MPALLANSPPPDLIDRISSFGFLAAALIVLVFGILAIMSVLRIYRKRLFRDPNPPTKVVNAWDESARRMATPPPEPGDDESDDEPDDGPDDEDDDDDGDFPLEPAPVPSAPGKTLSV